MWSKKPRTVKPKEACFPFVTAAEGAGNKNPVLFGDGYRAHIKRLVMQRTERYAVGHHVRAAVGKPFNVCCFHPNDDRSDLPVVTAHCTTVLVGAKDSIGKPGVASSLGLSFVRALFRAEVEANLGEDVGVQRLREVRI